MSKSREFSAKTINARYNQKNLELEDITDDVIMIRINTTYYNGISDFDLYEMTRCCWKVNLNQASKVKYVFSIYDGMVSSVFSKGNQNPVKYVLHE